MNNIELYDLLAAEITSAPDSDTLALVEEMEALMLRMSPMERDTVLGITRF